MREPKPRIPPGDPVSEENESKTERFPELEPTSPIRPAAKQRLVDFAHSCDLVRYALHSEHPPSIPN
jgi:hypothetical protein